MWGGEDSPDNNLQAVSGEFRLGDKVEEQKDKEVNDIENQIGKVKHLISQRDGGRKQER